MIGRRPSLDMGGVFLINLAAVAQWYSGRLAIGKLWILESPFVITCNLFFCTTLIQSKLTIGVTVFN